MKILVILEDEIIQSLFQNRYVELMPEVEIQFGEYNDFYHAEIRAGLYEMVICDLDEGMEKVVSFYEESGNQTPFLFITDWEYSRYLGLLKEGKITNIYPKGLLIEDYKTSAKMIQNLVKGSIFGIHNYTEYPIFLETMTIHYSSEIRKLSFKINFLFPFLNKEKAMQIKLSFYEIASNAFFHSHSLEKGSESYIRDPIYISFAEDSEKIIFSITDKKGTLDRHTVLYWLFKRFHNEKNLPEEHGRGFFLMKNLIDNLIINIDQNKRTEFIAIFYKNDYMGEKSLLIHQI
jgi:anti-sigma regulatory factor (Ser/Thr protein kinase)